MNRIIIIVLLATLFAYACSKMDHPVEQVFETYANGNIKIKHILKSKTDTFNYIAETYYENGQLKSVGTMQDSVVVGYWREYFENGNLKQNGNYAIDDSLNNGNWTYSYKRPVRGKDGSILKKFDGWTCSVAEFAREKKNLHVCKVGPWVHYHENGEVKSKGSYKNGWPDGKWIEYADNGKKILLANYENGQPIYQWTYWYPSGQLMKVVDHTGSMKLLMEAYNEQGVQQIINGRGQFMEVDPIQSSELFMATYDKGIMNGSYKKYFNNGKIEEEGNFLNGKRHGLWTLYQFHFGKWIERTYSNDTLNGYVYEFSNNDTMRIQYFVNGLEHGISKHYEYGISNGYPKQISFVECWNMGKRHGIREMYDLNGDLTELDYFYADEYIGYEIFNKNKILDRSISDKDKEKFKHLDAH